MVAMQCEPEPPTEVRLDDASTPFRRQLKDGSGWRDTSKEKSRGLGQSEPGMHNPKATHDHHHH
jgi:hypothetical protein